MEIFCWTNRMKENKINMPCKIKFGNKNANSADCFIFKPTKLYALETYRRIKRVTEVCRPRYNFILFKLFVKKSFVCSHKMPQKRIRGSYSRRDY